MTRVKTVSKYILLAGWGLISLASVCKDDGTDSGFFRDVTVEEAYQLVQESVDNPDFVILDVRTAGEFAGEHIENAVNIDYYAEDFRDQLDALDKEKTYLVYCRSGGRSGNAVDIMQELGFQRVYNMLGGITDWKTAGYPVVT